MPKITKKTVRTAKDMLVSLTGVTQTFDAKNVLIKSVEHIKVIRQALFWFIRENDFDWKVAEIVNAGELHLENGNTAGDIIAEAAGALDKSEAGEIVGPQVMFKATNGKHYTVEVQARIVECSPAWVRKCWPRSKVRQKPKAPKIPNDSMKISLRMIPGR